jgi:hypothetical protein
MPSYNMGGEHILPQGNINIDIYVCNKDNYINLGNEYEWNN